MVATPCHALDEPVPVSLALSRRRGQGGLGSVLLHGMVLAMLLAWHQTPSLPPQEVPLTVDLVPWAGQSQSPQPGNSTQPAPVQRPTPPVPDQARPAQVPPSGYGKPAHHDVQAHLAPSHGDDFDAQLRAAAKSSASGAMTASVGGNGHNLGKGGPGAYGVKDYLRSQIQRRWNFDVAQLGQRHWLIAVHVVLAADGTVETAVVQEDADLKTDPAYRALVQSARNAVLVSSPLHLPRDLPPEARDLVLEFDPRAALR